MFHKVVVYKSSRQGCYDVQVGEIVKELKRDYKVQLPNGETENFSIDTQRSRSKFSSNEISVYGSEEKFKEGLASYQERERKYREAQEEKARQRELKEREMDRKRLAAAAVIEPQITNFVSGGSGHLVNPNFRIDGINMVMVVSIEQTEDYESGRDEDGKFITITVPAINVSIATHYFDKHGYGNNRTHISHRVKTMLDGIAEYCADMQGYW